MNINDLAEEFAESEQEAVDVLCKSIPESGGHVDRATLEIIIRAAFRGGVVAAKTIPEDNRN